MTRYAIDLDGTLADTVGATLEIFNERYGTRYTKADVTEWHFWNSFPELQTLPESRRKNVVMRMMDEAWIGGRVKPEPGAVVFMVELLRREPQVDIVTGRSMGTPTAVIERWLAKNGIPYRSLVRVKGSQEKVYHDYDVYWDDDPNLALDIQNRWLDKRAYLVSQPWNREVQEMSRITRVSDLHETLPHRGGQVRPFRRPEVRVRGHERRIA